MAFPNVISGKYGWEKQQTSTQRQRLGTEMQFVDGRKFRYVEVGGTAITEGLLVAAEAVVGNHDEDLVVTTSPSAGDTTIGITLGGTAAAKDLYAEGYLFFNVPILATSANPHEMYKIKSHAAVSSSGTGTFTIDEEDGFTTAVTAGTETAGLIKSPYKDVIVAPAAVAGRFVGVTTRSMTADYFGWIQVAGIATVAIDGTPAVGTVVGASSNHAGQFLVIGADTSPAVARVHGKAGVDNEYHTVMLMNLY
jgi:hypothetical protein